MNEKQLYEKHLVEKLEKLTQPGDASQHWPQMKALLNREMPEEGAGKKRPGPWWMFGIVAGILITGTLAGSLYVTNNKYEKLPDAAGTTSTNSKEETITKPAVSLPEMNSENSMETAKTGNDKTTASNKLATSKSTASTFSTLEENKTKDEKITESKTIKNLAKNNAALNNSKKEITSVITDKENVKTSVPKKILTDNSVGTSINNLKLVRKNEGDLVGKGVKENRLIKDKKSKEPIDNSIRSVVYTPDAKGVDTRKSTIKNTVVEKRLPEYSTKEETIKFSLVKQPINNLTESVISPSSIIKDSLNSNYTAQLTTVPYEAIVRTRFKSNTDRVKALKNRVVGTGDNKNFVVGLSLPLAFPLSDQKVVAYNFTGGVNTALDYLPVPHIQYHINQKSYVQAEIQFVSPQYIQPALVSQNKFEIPGTASSFRYITNSVFARKLFYFNLPIGVHYSPFKNFYLGTGMQFSSLLSGIAMYEQRGYNSLGPSSRDTLIYQNFNKFKNDSISESLNGNEFRLMMDANYYWHRFTVGLRYNQALSNYISIRVSNTSPLFTDKNKSMQFYLRYNLWEDKKRKKTGLLAGR